MVQLIFTSTCVCVFFFFLHLSPVSLDTSRLDFPSAALTDVVEGISLNLMHVDLDHKRAVVMF